MRKPFHVLGVKLPIVFTFTTYCSLHNLWVSFERIPHAFHVQWKQMWHFEILFSEEQTPKSYYQVSKSSLDKDKIGQKPKPCRSITWLLHGHYQSHMTGNGPQDHEDNHKWFERQF